MNRELRVREFTEYKVAWLECPRCGAKLNLFHRETPHRKKASHRVEVKVGGENEV